MSSRHRTNKKPKGPGYDFNGRRPPYGHCMSYGPFAKKITHRKERREAVRIVREQVEC